MKKRIKGLLITITMGLIFSYWLEWKLHQNPHFGTKTIPFIALPTQIMDSDLPNDGSSFSFHLKHQQYKGLDQEPSDPIQKQG